MNRAFPSFVASLSLVVAFLTFPLPSQAQVASPVAMPGRSVAGRIEEVFSQPLFRNALIGVLVQSEDGRTIYEKNADFALMPASNMKLITGATAAYRLGPTFRYTTTLLHTGKIASGTVTGDLYLKGSGDPSLLSSDLKTLAEALKARGVNEFRGKVVADASAFDERMLGEGWQWDDEPYYYQAQVAGLNCDRNYIAYEVRPGAKPGDPAIVRIGANDSETLGFRDTRFVTMQNRAVTGAAGSKTDLSFERTRARNEVVITGTIALDARPIVDEVTVEDPARFTAARFYELMAVIGIKVPESKEWRIETGNVPANATVVAEHQSKPLSELLAEFLKPSDNLYGECLLKTIGAAKGNVGSWEAGRREIRATLATLGVDTSGLMVADGSGLSRNNNVTPRMLVSLLTAVDKSFSLEARTMFVNALPVGGVDGTLRNRFKNTGAQGNVRAKTGSLTGVSALSGYLTTAAGERLVFSMMMNHYTSAGSTAQARAAQDALVLALLDMPKPTLTVIPGKP